MSATFSKGPYFSLAKTVVQQVMYVHSFTCVETFIDFSLNFEVLKL